MRTHSDDYTVEELEGHLALSDDLADEAEHRWTQGRAALWIAAFFGSSVALCAMMDDVAGAWIVLGGMVVFASVGFGVWKWSLALWKESTEVITYAE